MKTRTIVLIILAALLFGTADVAIWQRNNIQPYLMGKLYDEEALNQKIQDTLDKQEKRLADKGVTVDGFTREEILKMISGKLDEETAIERLRSRQTAKEANANGENRNRSGAEAVLNECVAKLYEYEAQMYAQLGAAWQDAVSAWRSTPREKRTSELYQSIKSESISRCYNLEVDADRLVNATLDEYRSKMAEAGGNTSDIDALWNVYCAKKTAVKAYYYNQI